MWARAPDSDLKSVSTQRGIEDGCAAVGTINPARSAASFQDGIISRSTTRRL